MNERRQRLGIDIDRRVIYTRKIKKSGKNQHQRKIVPLSVEYGRNGDRKISRRDTFILCGHGQIRAVD